MLTKTSDPASLSDMKLLQDLARFCVPDPLINAQQIVDLDAAFPEDPQERSFPA